MTTAYINDVDGLGVFAQQLFGYGKTGDVFLGISTSGNSENIMNATVVARAMGIKVIGLTGMTGGELAEVADVVVKAPEEETYMIQEFTSSNLSLLVLNVGRKVFWNKIERYMIGAKLCIH